MSLTSVDLQEIRTIFKEEIKPLKGEVEALRNDIKDIYDMISDLQKSGIHDKHFTKLTLEEQLLALNSKLLAAAKQAGITLPR